METLTLPETTPDVLAAASAQPPAIAPGTPAEASTAQTATETSTPPAGASQDGPKTSTRRGPGRPRKPAPDATEGEPTTRADDSDDDNVQLDVPSHMVHAFAAVMTRRPIPQPDPDEVNNTIALELLSLSPAMRDHLREFLQLSPATRAFLASASRG